MGQYFYLGEQDGSAFEVVFVEIGSGFEKRVEGSVLDNCNLGEAMVSGSFTYPSLQFIKTYISVRIDPVEYRGTMNEDGTMIAGTGTSAREIKTLVPPWAPGLPLEATAEKNLPSMSIKPKTKLMTK